MIQFKNAKVVMLPTNDNSSDIELHIKRNRLYHKINDKTNYEYNRIISLDWCKQHLYIVSDDEIKESDWFIDNNQIFKCNDIKIGYWNVGESNKSNAISSEFRKHEIDNCKKIIATTDTTLKPSCTCTESAAIYCGSKCQKPLPQIPQDFISKYIESYNKKECIIDVLVDVLVEYEDTFKGKKPFDKYEGTFIKVNKDNIINIVSPKTINIISPKTIYTKEEVENLIQLVWATASNLWR